MRPQTPSGRFGFDAAKLVPPSLAGLVARPALEQALDGLLEPSLWLCAPSGAGKSMLVAAYAARQSVPLLWYRLDERDNDPAFFFDHLLLALEGAQQAAMPCYSDSDRDGEAQYVRRLLAQCTGDSILFVFDDVQEVTSERTLAALGALANRISLPSRAIFIGNREPDEPFYAAIAASRLRLLRQLDLSFGAEECEHFAATLGLTREQAMSLHAITHGHAAALVMASQLIPARGDVLLQQDDAMERIHRFLLNSLVDRLPAPQRDLLVGCCWLPTLTADRIKATLGRVHDVDNDLRALVQRGLLTLYAAEGEPQYRPHALVRDGLMRLAQATEAGQRSAVACGRALLDEGACAEAFSLLVAAGCQAQALVALEQLARDCARQRRVDSVVAALQRIDPAAARPRASLCFWLGQALLGDDLRRARQWLSAASDAAQRQGDAGLRAAACATLLITYVVHPDNLTDLSSLVSEFRQARAAAGPLPGHAGLMALASLIMRYANAAADDEPDSEATLLLLMAAFSKPAEWPSPYVQLDAATALLDYVAACHGEERAREFALRTAGLANDPKASRLARGRWWIERAWLHASEADATALERCLEQADQLAAEGELPEVRFMSLIVRATAAMRQGVAERALVLLPEMERLVELLEPAFVRLYGRISAGVLLMSGRPGEALQRAEAALAAVQAELQTPAAYPAFVMEVAAALAGLGRHAEAEQRLRQFIGEVRGHPAAVDLATLADGYAWQASGEQDDAALRRCFAQAAQGLYYALFGRAPADLARMCDRALTLQIEPAFVTALIRRRSLRPPADATDAWPWTVRIYSLGAFRLLLDGNPYRPAQKAQDKVLELLKLLVAAQVIRHGAPDREWLCDQLWPDAPAERARKSLETAVARLRRLLCCDEAIVVSEGRVALNPERVWTDLGALKHLAAALRTAARVPGAAPDARLRQLVREALSLYRGQFLHGADGAAWALGARAQASRILGGIVAECELLLGDADRSDLAHALEQVLLAEPAAEEVARTLMRLYLGRAQHVDALRVYRACSDMLRASLGIGPSPQTETLRREVLSAAAVMRAPAGRYQR